jgi:hypothetical protein
MDGLLLLEQAQLMAAAAGAARAGVKMTSVV